MIILDFEYYLSSYMANIEYSKLSQYLSQYPECVSLNEFGDWKPLNNSIFNLFLNYPNYNNGNICYTFKRLTSTMEVNTIFKNTFFRERVNSLLRTSKIYIGDVNGTNILNFDNNDLNIINEIILNNISSLSSFQSTNPIINTFINLVNSVINSSYVPPMIQENMDDISQIISFIAMNNQNMLLLQKNIEVIN